MSRALLVAAAVLSTSANIANFALTASAGSLAAGATPPAPERAVARTACIDDYRKYCAGVRRGGGRILQCMMSHRAELTPACRDTLGQARTGAP